MFQNVASFDAFYFQFYKLIRWRVLAYIRSITSEKEPFNRGVEPQPTNQDYCYRLKKKNSSTLIKVIVALSNLSVFKCLQDVHVNFMNPSVFVIQPSAKGKNEFSH